MNKLIYSSLGAAMLASAAFGQISYTPGTAEGCIPFVNGSGNYANNCYISGLHNMAPNTCYHVRQSRINDGSVNTQYINDNAADTWWWKTTDCVKVPIQVPVQGTYTLDPKCVQFHNGSGHYADNCYNSGLINMDEDKCYAVNPARIADGSLPQNAHMNNNAHDTWWWVEAECYNLVPVYPPSICNTAPSDPQCQSFCTGLPVNQFCQDNFCSVFPGSCGGPTPVCNDITDPNCALACAADPTVSSNCSAALCYDDPDNATICRPVCAVDRHGTACEAFCTRNPTDPACNGSGTTPVTTPTQEDCLVDPLGQNCQDFCTAHPGDGACDANYCASNPNDPNCFDKCLNFVNGAGNYRQHCYKSGLENMQPGKCYKPNPARGNQIPVTGHMNNNAADGWWWVQTTCEKEYIIPRVNWTLDVSKCVAFVHGSGNYVGKCFNSGLQNMPANNVAQNKCYKVNPDRVTDGSAYTQYINNNAADLWWWVETLCQDTLPARAPRPAPVFEGKVAPKAVQAAPALGESEISVDNTTLSVTSTIADTKMLRVFDMNGKLLHSESFSGLAKDVDFAKFAGKGILLVRITSGNKLVAMKKVSIR